jgi:hypothetical protein
MQLRDVSTPDEEPGARHQRPPCASQHLSSQQAYEAAYRFVSRYYDHERTAAIRRLLEAMSASGDAPDSATEARSMWSVSVEATLEASPLPPLSPAWDT